MGKKASSSLNTHAIDRYTQRLRALKQAAEGIKGVQAETADAGTLTGGIKSGAKNILGKAGSFLNSGLTRGAAASQLPSPPHPQAQEQPILQLEQVFGQIQVHSQYQQPQPLDITLTIGQVTQAQSPLQAQLRTQQPHQ